MNYETIVSAEQLAEFCERIATEPVIGFDTEFVSEDCYRPELCLIQVAAGEHLAIIDPYPVGDTQPFWDLLVTPGRTVVAHAAREEIRFAYRYTGKPIAGLFDTQLAAGFVGIEYPASLGTLVQKLVGLTLPKGETRTNWRHRPLTSEQLTYALHDVTNLFEMFEKLRGEIDHLDRMSWVVEETQRLQQKVMDAEESENWHRVSGSSGLKPRQLEIVRQLWRWREAIAKSKDRLPRRIMRDDLIVELAKRGSADAAKIRSIRGLERRNYHDQYDDIAAAIQTGLNAHEDDLPRRSRGRSRAASPMLSQFLSTAIACISRQHKIAPAIVGNSDDVKDLLAYELTPRRGAAVPALLQGWRGDIVGKNFRKILAGKLAIRVADLTEDQPLEFFNCETTQ
ncbi:ribonuclease D [Allorhodopirellula heiligendammensis]|uniref:Ribonuclease D n=1 Tax=Allorhodopirellula heiligendammensis TaxID=2714739 RepID=A0A5C6BEF6_9BACT|nr:HRDC domain-containing protein [Allorhodopirellula heiligendammensis]TWU10122.1 Ribonuclease D [Allorhodopirellula heiligendammensis]